MSERRDDELARRVAQLAFDLAAEAIAVTDSDNAILAVNPAFTKITGFTQDEVLGRDPRGFMRSGLHDSRFHDELWEQVRRQGRWDGEVWSRRKNGETYHSWRSIVSDRDAGGTIRHHVHVFRDITEASDTAEQLWRHSNYDPLTELPNRRLFLDRLLQALVGAGRDKRRVALLFIGLDGFTNINDTLGHTVGDKVLQEAARRFQSALRPGDTLARFGGDEFTAVLTEITTVEEVEAVVRALGESLQEPLLIEAHRILTSCSVGISLWPGDGEDVESLMRASTSAMQSAKAAGRSTFRFFTASMDARAQARARLAHELSDALQHDEFTLVYQPLVETTTGHVAGAEALLRWHNRYIGAVGPDQFVPLAEEMGLILPIGQWLMKAACAEAARWQRELGRRMSVAINVSPRQVQQNDVCALLERALAETGLDPAQVTLEITESLFLSSGDEIVAKLNRIRAMGARIAVDDFGTGYASLSYLKHFPVDVLKIDRAFVMNLENNSDDARLVEAIIVLGHSLGMKVVGEGVETAEQLAFLAQRGCDLVQGYRFSPPLTAERFHGFVAAHP